MKWRMQASSGILVSLMALFLIVYVIWIALYTSEHADLQRRIESHFTVLLNSCPRECRNDPQAWKNAVMLVNSVSTNTFIDVLPAKRTFEMRLGDEIDKGIGKKTLIWALDYAAANDLNGRRHSQNHRQAVVEILSDCGEGN